MFYARAIYVVEERNILDVLAEQEELVYRRVIPKAITLSSSR